MEQSIDKKNSLKENITIFLIDNKKIIIFIVILLILFLTVAFIWNENQNKKIIDL